MRESTPTQPLTLLPPAPELCQVCAVDHEPFEPHNPQSLYWGMARQIAGHPAPTWEEALAHVKDPLRAVWVAAGVIVDQALLHMAGQTASYGEGR